jgi:hypothetical protein
MANQITVNSGSGNITVTTSRAVIGTVANVASANYANFAGEAFDVSGGNVTGAVANAVFATTAGTANTATSATTAATVTTAAQPNITSIGNLTSLDVTGTTTTGNLVVLGNLQVGNLVANTANFANFAGQAFNVSGANVTGAVANATFATTAGSANTANSATTAASANSVTLANVSGAGNIASINLDGSTSNVLYGNGIFAPAAGGNTANANYANFAGNAFSVDGGNVVGAVANANFALDAGNANIANIAYSIDGANVSGTVANATFALDAGNANIANIAYSVDAANVSGLGNIATINLDGNVSNLLTGNGTFVAIPTGGANANYANFAGTVLTNAQPNITSVGTLANLTVTGEQIVNGTLSVGNGAINVTRSDPSTSSEILFTVYGDGSQGEVIQLTRRRNGNSAARLGVNANDYLGNIEWTGAENTNGTGFNSFVKVAPKVDASYAGPGTTSLPVGLEFEVTDNTGNTITHSFNSNGDVQFAGNITATNLGNISSINLDGNASNFLDGTGNFVAAPGGANANYANFAGDVVNATQSNITQTGNLVLLNINNAVGNTVTNQFNPNLITVPTTFAFPNAVSVIKTSGVTGALNTVQPFYIIKDRPGNAAANNNDFIVRNVFGATSSSGNVTVATDFFNQVRGTPGTGNAWVPGSFSWRNALTNGNLTPSSTFTTGFISMNQLGTFGVSAGAPGSSGISISTFGTQSGTISNTAPATSLSVSRGRGNGDSRLTVEPNDYIGDFTWVGTVANGFSGGQTAKLRARIDSTYVANTTDMPIGFELQTVGNGGALNTHNFYANGDVTFANVVNATTFVGNIASSNVTGLGNIATINLDGNASNFLDGTGNFVAAPGGANANYANFAGQVIDATQPNITSVGTLANLNVTGQTSLSNALFITRSEPQSNQSEILFTVYGDGSQGEVIQLTRRRNGNSSARLGVNANDYLGNIEWTGAENTNGTGFNSFVKVAPKVDASYAGPGTDPLPLGLEFEVTDNTGNTITHSFNSNGNVTFSNAVNANTLTANYLYGDGSNISNISAGTPNSIQNGNSVVNFTGVDGDLNISTNNITNGVQVSGRSLFMNGDNTGPGNISSIQLNDGALNWTLDNTNFGGGTPFGMNRYISGFMDPMNYFTARGNTSSPADVQAGDSAFNERVQVRYDSATKNIFNADVNVRSFSPSNAVAATYSIGSSDDTANSVFQVNFGTSNIAGNLEIGAANSFLRLASIDSSVLANITGQGGQVAAVDDNGGKLAFWDTTNNRWSYVFDNSAV